MKAAAASFPLPYPPPQGGRGDVRPLVAQELRQGIAKFRTDIRASECIGDIGDQESGFRSRIVGAAAVTEAGEALRLSETLHRVGDLDLAPGARFLTFEQVKNLRLQNVATGDDEIRR